MFLRTVATALFTLASVPAQALCVGTSYLDQLTDAERATIATAAAQTPYGQGLFWSAERDGKSMTVIGTIHIYDQRLDPIHANLRDVVVNADLVLLEATAAEEAQLQNLLLTEPDMLFITDGPTLPDALDDATWKKIAEAAKLRQIPSFLAAKMQPWYLSMILSIPPCAVTDMASGARGLDHMIQDDATAAGIPLQALEPFTTLFDIFRDEPFDEQIDMLRVNLTGPEMQQQMFVAMLDSYFAQDTARLWEMTRLAIQNAPDIDPEQAEEVLNDTEQSLLIDRNENWMPIIDDATLVHDNIVVAVGAAHLIGERGVLQLLENEGWKISRRN